ncbi:uncharacterized protein EHS24_001921 [Apiotrichum porosum]|uniref:Uncharacterized protein n=1 Tax=Apiotrichum porosum TaxID=105984 RepID=A0A427XJB7_9TREE|nr:uncharacterized protein EHS24_001921 [Apiotrichum porosum]RSH78995.1 hypothetical protein EHS24_001921 [Apiotrichum porosum]
MIFTETRRPLAPPLHRFDEIPRLGFLRPFASIAANLLDGTPRVTIVGLENVNQKALRKHSSTLRQPDGYLGILAPAIESIRRSRTIYPRSRQQLTLVGIEGIPVHLMGLHTGTTYEEALVHIRNAIRSRSPSKPKNTFMAIGFQTLDERRATLGVEEFLLETEYLQCWERAT